MLKSSPGVLEVGDGKGVAASAGPEFEDESKTIFALMGKEMNGNASQDERLQLGALHSHFVNNRFVFTFDYEIKKNVAGKELLLFSVHIEGEKLVFDHKTSLALRDFNIYQSRYISMLTRLGYHVRIVKPRPRRNECWVRVLRYLASYIPTP